MRDVAIRLSEGRAIAKQLGLIARNLRRADAPVAGRRVVVFVHGYFAGAPVFDPLRQRVEAELAFPTLSFGYASYGGFEATAERLARTIDDGLPAETEVILVGHSLGGILARWYVQELGGKDRVRHLVTLNTPHRGTRAAQLAPFGLGAAIRPGSPVLERLGEGDGKPPIYAIAGSHDTTVPVESALGCHATRAVRVEGVGHNNILYDARAHRVILDAVRGDAPRGDA